MTEPVIGRQELQAVLKEVARLRRRVEQLERRQTTHASFAEITDPDAPEDSSVRVYASDAGSGKTQLVARFPTGSVQQITVEP